MKNNEQTAAIDASSLWHALNPEEVTRGQIDGLYDAAEYALQSCGVTSRLNGQPATVTEVYIPVTAGDETLFARIYKKGNQVGIAFDTTSDIHVTTSNPNALFFSELPLGMSIRADASVEPIIDDPAHVALATKVIKGITEQSNAVIEKRAAMAKEEAARNAELIAIAKRDKALAKEGKRIARHRTIRKYAGVGAFSLGVAGMAGLGGYVIVNADHASFDELNPAPTIDTAGTLIAEGETLSPAFAQDLLDKGIFKGTDSEIPDLVEYGYNSAQLDRDDVNPLTSSAPLREVHIESSEGDKRCTTFEVRAPDETWLEAWTDFRNPDEITVSFDNGTGKVCWENGQERDDTDDPRIVLRLQPAEAKQSSTD